MAVPALLMCTALALNKRHKNADSWVSQEGGYPYNKSLPYWTDTPVLERGAPPYSPPADWTYTTRGAPRAGMINVHLVAHSHDDTGWQITVDQYFYQQVYYILDTLLVRLTEDPNRRFMFVETGFLARWWDTQPEHKQVQFRSLVEGGQLEFVNGGWCMHDEASPYYVEMVDQTTRGHQFLSSKFGTAGLPKGSWTIDPFGHSSTNAWLIGAESGMDYLFWGRMDYQDFAARKPEKKLEWIWEGSESLGSAAQIFAGELFGGGNGGYSTWIGYNGGGTTVQVNDDPTRHDYNVDMIVDQFVQHAHTQADSTATEHQLWACGGDFNYQNADTWMHNLDKTIHYVNLNGSVNAFYSTPTLYVTEKKKAQQSWEIRRDDIFPLGDAAHHYWSGYFTSRPGLKRQVRRASNFLNAARQMEVIGRVNASAMKVTVERPSPPVGTSWTDSLEGAIGIATHHDGMSGTERQSVSNDYEQRISESQEESEDGVALSFSKLLGTTAKFTHCNCNSMNGMNCLNISMCELTTNSQEFTIMAWNPLGRNSTQSISVPVTVGLTSEYQVFGPENRLLESDVVALGERTLELPLLYLNSFGMTDQEKQTALDKLQNDATHVLSFTVELPPVSFTKIHVKGLPAGTSNRVAKKSTPAPITKSTVTISNEAYRLEFNNATGMTELIHNVATGHQTPFTVTTGWYNSSDGGCTAGVASDVACDSQKSGAYIFRPNSTTLYYPGTKQTPTLKVVYGEQVEEVHQVFSSWVTCVYRLWKGRKSLEVEWTVGPIPIDTPWLPGDIYPGKEVVFRYSTGLKSAGTFYTDSNGREMVKRQRNARGPSYPKLVENEPIAANYYPVTGMIAVQDSENQLAVLTDVAQGGASIEDGAVELMVHRRLQIDDSRGVQEPLNETMCGCNDINAGESNMGEHGKEGDGGCVCEGLTMRGKHLILFDTIERTNVQRRQESEELSFPATLAFVEGNVTSRKTQESFLTRALPDTVKLMTLNANYMTLNGGRVMLRLAHLYQANESVTHSVPVVVDFSKVFDHASLKITEMTETSLTGTIPLAEMDANKFQWKTHTPNEGVAEQFRNSHGFTRSYLKDFTVTIKPMEVRTFLVTFKK